MGCIPRISETEWLIMKVLWQNSPLSANQVIDALSGRVKWSPLTIRTLLGRLVSKGALEQKKAGNALQYCPLVSEKDCVRAENTSFLKKVHNGALKSMMASFFEEQVLSESEIEELKAILDRKKRDGEV